MMNHKLLVFVIAIPIFTILTVDWYQSRGFDETEDVTSDQCDPPDNEDIAPAIHNAPVVDWIRVYTLSHLIHAYSHLPDLKEAEFNKFCKDITENYDCLSEKYDRHFGHRSFGTVVDLFNTCNLPYFKTAFNLCKLTFDDAVDAQKCFKAAMKYYSGSREQAECRKVCCHYSSTFDASKSALCAPENNDIYNMFSEVYYCDIAALDQTMKDNDCMKVCLAKFWTQYAKHFCKAEAVSVFKTFVTAVEKKLSSDQCYRWCLPDPDLY